jgi:hypothetical protein
MFMRMGWVDVSELRAPAGLLSIVHVIYEYWEQRWNDIGRGRPKSSEKKLSQCLFKSHKSHIDWYGRETVSPRWEVVD